MRNIKMLLEYDGANFSGFQIQPGASTTGGDARDPADFGGFQIQPGGCRRTIQGEIEAALFKILGEKVRICAAGRTDAGVHALGQLINFKTASERGLDEIRNAANAYLPPQIVIRKTEEAPLDFHARFSAKSRLYRYLILNRETPPALGRKLLHHVRKPLDLDSMREASRLFVGSMDFSSFCTGMSKDPRSTVRTVFSLEIESPGGFPEPFFDALPGSGSLVAIKIRANAFLHSMVRMIAGTLIKVGSGAIDPAAVREILDARDPRLGGPAAPPYGLYLVEVEY